MKNLKVVIGDIIIHWYLISLFLYDNEYLENLSFLIPLFSILLFISALFISFVLRSGFENKDNLSDELQKEFERLYKYFTKKKNLLFGVYDFITDVSLLILLALNKMNFSLVMFILILTSLRSSKKYVKARTLNK